MNRRKFIETSGVAAGAAVLGGVNSSAKAEPWKKAKISKSRQN